MSVTLKDIARETGLSVATVSKYINGVPLREKNRIAIERAIKKTGYTVNEYARGLKSNRSRTIGVVIPELSNLFVTQIITKIEEILRAKGYSVMICDCRTDEALECEAVAFLLSKRVDGLINMPVCRDGRHLRPAVEKELPVVLIDRPIDGMQGVCDSVLIDNRGAAFDATRHLLAHGHTSIGIIVGPDGVFTSNHRLEGYKQALRQAGLPVEPRLIRHSDYTVQGGHESLCSLAEQNPDMTAVFVTNYEMTLGAMIAVGERGIRIPSELSLIGFDHMDLSRVLQPRLTIVTQPLAEIGAQVAKVMLERLTGQLTGSAVSISLSAGLVQGASVAPRA